MKLTSYGYASTTSNSLTRKVGLSMAPCSAHPFATDSVALSVRLGSFPKSSMSALPRKGMRLAPPTSSMLAQSSGFIPASASALWMGTMARPSCSFASSSSRSRVSVARTSTSSMMHSTLSPVSGLMLSTFFAFSTATRSRRVALALERTSILYFSRNSLHRCWYRQSSKLAPPKLRSYPVPRISSLPFLNATTLTCIELCPTSTKHTFSGSVSGRSVL
mmetsp:Transcript_10607/g.36872  ORF Transcript_10607/g.36872 Transcript_10607/m.36872 type:complete len:219 (+) Transcript_10607:1357-2013(+)